MLGNVRDARHKTAEMQLDKRVSLQRPRHQHSPTDSVTPACDALPALGLVMCVEWKFAKNGVSRRSLLDTAHIKSPITSGENWWRLEKNQ